MDEILKGNFKVKNPVKLKENTSKKQSLKDTLREKALGSLGGSMVYVERNKLNWDGDEQSKR